jgi:Glycosyl hydrolase catalytic core
MPRMVLFSLFAALSLLWEQPRYALAKTARATTTTTTATVQQLAARQPPPTGSGSDRFAMDVNCDLWRADRNALSECSKDLDLTSRLGVGTVRLAVSWESMTLADGSTLAPHKAAFLKSILNAARTRGMKILFQVGMYAPASAYQCSSTQNPPTAPSSRLDFCDAAFTKYLGSLMDTVLPFTADIELFNETNWSFSATDPSYGDPNGISGYILARSKTLYSEAKTVLNTKRQSGYKTVLHTQGISYFYNSAYPNNGWRPPAGSELIEAIDYLKALGNNANNASSVLNTTIDVVDVHPYFNSADFPVLMRSFMTTVSSLVAGGSKPIWITETNNGMDSTDAGQLAVFNQLKILMDNGSVAKAFWYVVRNCVPGNGEGDGYSIYDCNRHLIRPQLAAAIQAYTATTPQGQRFLSGSYLMPIK